MAIKISGTTVIDDSRNIQNIGVATATTFSGNLTGNVTGNATGLSGTPNLNVGIVTATSFSGDGSSLSNTGATLSAGSGSQRLVVTSSTSGIMTTAATDADLTWNSTTNTLSATNVSIAGTLTYEDVTNVDSIGIVTARTGAHIATLSGNLLVGSTSATGTSSQPLQVTGGAYVSGNLGVGATNPSYKTHIVGSNDILALESLNSAERTTLKLITNGSDWEIGARGSASSPANAFYIHDNAAGAYRQIIDSSGNLLIGGTSSSTGTSSQPLQVNGGGYFSGSIGIGDTNPTATQTTQLSLSGYNAGGGVGYNQFLKVKNTYGSATNPNKYFRLSSIGAIEVVNDAYTAVIFTLDNSGNITAAGNVGGYSDIRLKDNIQTIPNALDKVSKLRGVEFDRNDIEENPHQIGVIAQEVEEIIPEVVTTHSDGIKSVSYGNLVGLLIEAIKDLKEEVNELKVKLEEK